MNNFMGYGDEEIETRIAKIGKFFTILGVDASSERIEGYVEATLALPWRRDEVFYFTGALLAVIQAKDDGYQTAPQPGVILAAAKKLIPRDEWEYCGAQGMLPPRWWVQMERAQSGQKLLPSGGDRPRLASGTARDKADKAWLLGDDDDDPFSGGGDDNTL